jgi:3D (Asp-Asp-Asp) domain-containing protein
MTHYLRTCAATIVAVFTLPAYANIIGFDPQTHIDRIKELQAQWQVHERAQELLHDEADEARRTLCAGGVIEYCPIDRGVLPIVVTVTNYNPEPGQTDGSPCTGANSTDLCAMSKTERVAAASRNLLRRWGAAIAYGDKVLIQHERPECSGVFRIEDTMHERFSDYIDVFHMDRADNFGLCRGATLQLLRENV